MTYSDLVDYFGPITRTALAKKLDVTRQTLIVWERDGIPADKQRLLEYDTRGQLRVDEGIRPPSYAL